MSPRPRRYHLLVSAFMFIITGVLTGIPIPTTPVQAEETPQVLLNNNVLSDWTIGGPRLIWLTYPDCFVPGGTSDPVRLYRIASTGSGIRTIFSRNDARPPDTCNPYKLNSNIVADDKYVYWVDGNTMVRLSVEANPGDPPQPWGPTFGSGRVELAIARDHIVAMQAYDCSFCILGTWFTVINRADGSTTIEQFARAEFGSNPAYDGKYIYFRNLDSDLRRITPDSNDPAFTIATAVREYVAEGNLLLCTNFGPNPNCNTTSYVFYIQTLGINSIVRFNNLDGAYKLIYFPNPPGGQLTRIYGLTMGNRVGWLSFGPSLFFFEKRYTPCPVPPGCFVTEATDLLRTVGREGGSAGDLYARLTDTAHYAQGMRSDGFNLFWGEQQTTGPMFPSTIKRLPTDASTLPKINLTATGIEITQGIQRDDNSVRLVQLRPTFVRVFARATGDSVPGVTAHLQASATGLGTITLIPINPNLGSRIRVFVNPSRGVTNDSFIFELPWQYTQASDLRLTAIINPYGVPLEPTLADNTVQAGPFNFLPTPRLNVTFVEFNYRLNNTDYTPQGTSKNVNWISRVYPLGATIGFDGWNYGLNYRVWQVNDAGLAARVNRQLPECEPFLVRNSDGSIKTDNRELCASAYVNGLLRDLRSRRNVPEGTFLYGEIPDSGVNGQFPRGQEGGSSVSSGPDGLSWDGYYAGHEIGHSLGLGHPATANGSCNLVGSDPLPPYSNGWIGKADSSIVGFDSRDGTFGGKIGVLAGASYFDMMAYCQPQWISDINYERIYTNLTGVAKVAANAPQAGDWLSVFGNVTTAGDHVAVSLIRRMAGTVTPPDRTPGDYTVRLLNAQGTKLAEYPFTPEPDDDGSGWSSFGLVVPFESGTTRVQIIRISTGAILYSQAISAGQPAVSGIALQGTPDPTTGAVTLIWNASDPDGDSLRYEVLFSRDGGISFIPLLRGLSSPNATIDPAVVGGGSRIFRVIASDGVQSSEADSAPITIAPQPPRPQILTPANGARMEWGQLINLHGEASDPQDDKVADAGLIWSNKNGTLGSGPKVALTELPVGTNQITLTATNSTGLSASTSISITIGDDLSEPGPIMTVNPATVSWNIAAGSTDLLSTMLDIGNGGGGTFNWTASSNANWLTIPGPSGNPDDRLILNADPSGMAPNSIREGQITVNAFDAGGQLIQTIQISVTIYSGNPGYDEPVAELLYNQYLPWVLR